MRFHPRRLALFSLRPHLNNELAKRVVAHPWNINHVWTMTDSVKALDVGFHIHDESSMTLATLGHGIEADIHLEGSNIADIQCSFEIDSDTGVVMFFDRSHNFTTQVSGKNAMPFENGRARKILVQHEFNTVIELGGEQCDTIQFELVWHQDPTATAEIIKRYTATAYRHAENPSLSRSISQTATDLLSRREARPQAPGQTTLKMRYLKIGPVLGSGNFGTVYKAIDIDTGK